MSRLVGTAEERWSLRAAIDALAAAARVAGRPSWLWLAGFFYPGLSFTLGFDWLWILISGALSLESGEAVLPTSVRFQMFSTMTVPGAQALGTLLVANCAAPLLFPLLYPVFRWNVGLAGIAQPRAWSDRSRAGRGPTLRDAWSAGRGLALPTFGLWFQTVFLCLLAAIVLLGPVVLLGSILQGGATLPWIFYPLAGPSACLVLIFWMTCSLIFQLALHSLVQNRRGVASATLHAWRLARHDPWATARTVVVDGLLWSVFVAIAWLLYGLAWIPLLGFAAVAGVALLSGFVGVTRACFWARAYRELGGLGPDDNVPGLGR